MPQPATADPPLAGRYQLLDLAGVGGMGAVWRAWDLREHRFVAVKLLHRRGAGQLARADHLQRFVREQSLRIAHPHVAAPTGWVADDDLVALAMPLARGGTLADLLAEHGPLPLGFVVVLLGQLLDGLAAVHAAGVVHRDLKPANLLLEPTGYGRPHLRIGDFGVAAVLGDPPVGTTPDAGADAGGGVGTPGFAAPEQLAGAAPDPRQDLYSVGVLTRLLAGGADRLGPLAPWVEALTEQDPARRPGSAAAASAALSATSPGRVRRSERPYVPDRVGQAAVPLPAARRGVDSPPRPRETGAGPRLLLACFVVAAVLGVLAARLLLGAG